MKDMNSSTALSDCRIFCFLFLLFVSMFFMIPQVHANQIFSSDCAFGFQDIYGTDEAVCVSGDLDMTSEDFIFPTARIYVTRNLTWPNDLSDETTGGYNVIQGTSLGGAFFDEYVWLPPLKEGYYDLVIDENQNGVFDGIDYVAGAGYDYAFRVGPPVGASINVAAIKGRAGYLHIHFQGLADKWKWVGHSASAIGIAWSIGTGDVLSAVVGGVSWGLSALGIYDWPTDYNAGVLTIGGKVIEGLAAPMADHYRTLHDDPPDFNYTEVASLDINAINAELADQLEFTNIPDRYPFAPKTDSAYALVQVDLENNLAVQSALIDALIHSLEKYQGAELQGNREYMYMQARAVRDFSDMLVDNLNEASLILFDYQAELTGLGLGAHIHEVADIIALQNHLSAFGLTEEQRQSLRDIGMLDADIDYWIDRTINSDVPAADFTMNGALSELQTEVDNSIPDFQDLSDQAQTVMDTVAGEFDDHHPAADPGGPYSGNEGSPITFDASSSTDPDGDITTYEWDFDLDGEFDDASGVSADWSWSSEFTGLIGLRVTDATGLSDVAYANVIVSSVNDSPVIDALIPSGEGLSASVYSPLGFSVTAHDPDADPLSYSWNVDGVVASTSTAWTYTPGAGDSGLKLIRVTVSDGNPLSEDTYEIRRVAVYSDADGDTYTSDVDCDDGNAAVNPAAAEVCDGLDNNCDGAIDEGFDVDGDGVTTCGGDCDDGDDNNFPGNPEVCDGQDNNCDLAIDEGLNTDNDGDGVTECGGDCDDGDDNNFPGNPEVCDGQDNNCDLAIDEGFDVDGDGVTTCGGDCDDGDDNNFPGNVEICDGQDNNCDLTTDEGFDVDSDGFTSCGGDCDDDDPDVNPGETEIPYNGLDDDCNPFTSDMSGFIIAEDEQAFLYYARGNGDGTFSEYGMIGRFSGPNARAVTINDFDNDGYLDFIAGTGSGSTAYYYLFINNGDNTFMNTGLAGTQSSANSWAMDMASGDFNNDGNMDFLANVNTGITGIYLGDGKGGFTKTEVDLGSAGRGMDAADFDNDGNLDFVRSRYSSGYVDVYWGDGTGAFPASTFIGDTGDDPYGVVAGDFNNDGNMDVIANSGSGGDPYLFTGNGDRTFNAGVYAASLDFNYHGSYDAYDFNGDGNLDIVAVSHNYVRVLFYPGNGDGTFGAGTEIGTTSNYTLSISAPPIGTPVNVPVPVISPSSAAINEGGSVDFDGSGSSDGDGSIVAWGWDFGDGGTDSVENPDPHTYTDEGTYMAGLLVTDNDGKSSRTLAEIIVNGDAPSVDTSPVSFGEINADDGIWDFTLDGADYASDTEDNIVTYEWDFGTHRDNFEDGNSDDWDVYAGTWSVDNSDPITGSWSYRQTDTGTDRTWTFLDKEFFNDITIEVDVKLLSSNEEAHVLFRGRDRTDHYEFFIRGRGYNDVRLARIANTAYATLREYDLPSGSWGASYPIDTGNTYHIKIVCSGSLMHFYLDGHYLFSYTDDTFASGKVGFSAYRTDVMFDNLVVTETASGRNVQRNFGPAGVYNVDLTVTDSAGQMASGTIPMTMAPQDLPLSDAGGPYIADESAASGGGWTFSVDGSASSDDVEIRKYIWSFGTDEFSGTSFNSYKWYTSGGISQDDAVSLSGVSTWDTRYLVTRGAAFPKVKGQVFTAKIYSSDGGESMLGFKNTNTTNFHYNQFPYAFYLYYGNIYVYEYGASRGDTGYDFSYNTWNDFKIELKESGAVYSYRQSGTTDWTMVYDSGYAIGDTGLRKGMVVHSGTWTMDDFADTTAGMNPEFTLFRGMGAFNVDLTVFDRAGQSDADTAAIEITAGDAPVGDAGPDQSLAETEASEGTWTVIFDASGSTDDNPPIYLYEWDWDYDGTFDPSGDTGPNPTHSWNAPGTYTVAVRVTDHALQTHIDTMTVVITIGDPPVADANGPYVVDEDTGSAFEGGWTVTLDGSGSTDAETSIARYVWDLGTDTFDGTTVNAGKWVTGGNVTQDGAVSVVGNNNWGQNYIFSTDTYPRTKGMAFEAGIRHTSGNAMIGFKNTSDSYHYNQMTYALYFTNGNIFIYEDGANRGDTGYDYALNIDYEVRIELKETAGALYYYRPAGTPDWILVYDSNYSSAASFRRGADVNDTTFIIDNVKEIAAGVNPSYRFYGAGSRTISLTVWDQVNQTDTDLSSVTTEGNDPPAADAGPDQSGDEADSFESTWTFVFDGSAGSTDDFGIYTYEWDWDYDGTFDPSGDTGPTPSHTYDTTGAHTVALRVTDHALQSDIDTATVTITTGDPPVAEAGDDITTEGHWPILVNGGGSTDDFGIYTYDWDFGDYVDFIDDDGPTSKGTGTTPTHIYWEEGDYTVTLTVADRALQTDSDTLTVHVITGNAPVADAGGPYNAGAGGPPAYFNGSSSDDDFGIVKYLWDVDDTVDSDGDGNFTNDMDVVGAKPMYTYSAAGTYTVTLTVVDGAEQTDTASTTVNVAANMAPEVIAVPWVGTDPLSRHETYNGRSITLKAIVRDAGALTYQWNFGDGSPPYPATPAAVSNKYAIEVSHVYPDSPDNTPFTATLSVWDSGGLMGQDNYYVLVRPDNQETRTNIAIDEGLWYLHKTQDRDGADYGKWASYSSFYASPTGSAIQAFEINGHLQDGDNQENPYVETVTRGLDFMFTQLQSYPIGIQTYGDPDSNGNGLGIETNINNEIYEGGMVMDAIASSNMPLAFATTGGADVKGRFYYHILTDMVDMYSWGQVDSGSASGGWRYSWNTDSDNSACQWAAIGMLAARDNFGINMPQWVKDRNNTWLDYSYYPVNRWFGYTSAGAAGNYSSIATRPSGMVQMIMSVENYKNDSRWVGPESWFAEASNWDWFIGSRTYYGWYAFVKAMRLSGTELLSNGFDWNHGPNGVVDKLLGEQESDGSWPSGGQVTHPGYYGDSFVTSWAVIMLTPTLFVQPPVADAGDDIIWAYDIELQFDASGSFHKDPVRSIVQYEWDFDGDGTWDFVTEDPSDPDARFTYPDPDPDTQGDAPQVFVVRLRVTDDNEPAQTDVDTREVTAAEPPHAPFAGAGGTYTVTAGIPFNLDGSGSYDIDPGDTITLYQWDLDSDGIWFDDVDVETTGDMTPFVYATPGTYYIGLKVWDNGAFNPLGCTVGVDCVPLESLPDYATVTVEANEPPVADPNGPYVVDEGTPLTLDGSGSSDPNGDALTYDWDLDNDGDYDDGSGEHLTYTFMDNGVYTVGLRVSDSLLSDTASTAVVVNDVGPAASFTWTPQPQSEGSAVSFIDQSTSFPDTLISWSWDFAGLGSSSEQNPSFTFEDNGTYTVTLTVTDDDGSTDTVTHDVLIINVEPAVDAGDDETINEGDTVSFNGSFSDPGSSDTHTIEWDFGDGSAPAAGTLTPSHTYDDNGIYTVTMTVTDDDGGVASDSLTLTVNNVPPTVDAGPDQSIELGDTASLAPATFTDPGVLDVHTATINWDDGPVVPGAVTESSGSGSVSGSHAFGAVGVYVVEVSVTDNDGGTGSDTLIITVGISDQCPDDPNKTEPGICGCGVPDTDSDEDGTADCLDECPDDINKTEPGACGCGVSDVDTDGDGVEDCNETCDNDPDKTEPGICGCGVPDTDSDEDGTADCLDECPDDINKTEPGACGCGVSDVDTDGDGVEDCNETCDNDPDKTEPGICGCGVPDTDSDGDGTADCLDECPDDINKTEPGACGCGVSDVDTDGDGVEDCNEICDNDPDKTEPGICGCGVSDDDSDGDGVPDCNDNCPDDINKTEPGACGCGVSDVDTDGDGAEDCNETCDNDPDKTEPGICGCGVPDTDSDGDGVADCEDNCPDTPNPDQADSDGNGTGDACEGAPMQCDLDADQDVDIMDIRIIGSYRNQPAGACPGCDVDSDGVITVLDARVCIVQCTLPRCAAP